MTDSTRAMTVLALMVSLAVSLAAQGGRPNIILIVADDLGWTDLSSFGSKYYETPNIDKLAAAGMKFTSAYACPNCAPTRAALMSGRYCPRTGVYTVDSGERGLEKFRKMIPAPNRTTLPLSEVTIAEALKAAGYTTAHMGKWHLGKDEYLPTNQGFDLNIAGNERGAPGRGGSPGWPRGRTSVASNRARGEGITAISCPDQLACLVTAGGLWYTVRPAGH